MSVPGRFETDGIGAGEWQETHDKAAKWAVRAYQGIFDPNATVGHVFIVGLPI